MKKGSAQFLALSLCSLVLRLALWLATRFAAFHIRACAVQLAGRSPDADADADACANEEPNTSSEMTSGKAEANYKDQHTSASACAPECVGEWSHVKTREEYAPVQLIFAVDTPFSPRTQAPESDFKTALRF